MREKAKLLSELLDKHNPHQKPGFSGRPPVAGEQTPGRKQSSHPLDVLYRRKVIPKSAYIAGLRFRSDWELAHVTGEGTTNWSLVTATCSKAGRTTGFLHHTLSPARRTSWPPGHNFAASTRTSSRKMGEFRGIHRRRDSESIMGGRWRASGGSPLTWPVVAICWSYNVRTTRTPRAKGATPLVHSLNSDSDEFPRRSSRLTYDHALNEFHSCRMPPLHHRGPIATRSITPQFVGGLSRVVEQLELPAAAESDFDVHMLHSPGMHGAEHASVALMEFPDAEAL